VYNTLSAGRHQTHWYQPRSWETGESGKSSYLLEPRLLVKTRRIAGEEDAAAGRQELKLNGGNSDGKRNHQYGKTSGYGGEKRKGIKVLSGGNLLPGG